MANDNEDQWYFCTRHNTVEPFDTPCPGTYKTRDEAAHALDKVKERNAAWDAED
jgi:hypothetical protein